MSQRRRRVAAVRHIEIRDGSENENEASSEARVVRSRMGAARLWVPQNSGKGEMCGVCLEVMEASDKRCLLECGLGHVFHTACIEQWIRDKGTCPWDRKPVSGFTNVEKS